MLADREVFARRTLRALRTLLLTPLLCAHQIVDAATFTVTSAADTGGTTCASVCTLRQAINAANAAAGADTIAFNISGAGLHTISPATELPTIAGPVTVDGYTQPGALANSASTGTNAILEIEISGSAIAGSASGLTLGTTSAPSTIRGVVVNNFKASAIVFNSANIGGAVKGCFIGVNPSGTAAKPNFLDGVFVSAASSGVAIGGTALADRNLISGNSGDGILLVSSNNTVQGNLIGVAADGTSLLGNFNGVNANASNNLIGGTGTGAGNSIAGNAASGVLVARGLGAQVDGITIERNAIWANRLLGIDLSAVPLGSSADGVTPNDPGDNDAGNNHLQNFPVITSAGVSGSLLAILGTLNSTANRTFRVEFFASGVNDPSGFGEGQTYLGKQDVTTDAGGNGDFSIVGSPGSVTSLQIITATATDTVTGDTSEFSASMIVLSNQTVFNTNDSGQGSLRQAILNANGHAGADTIDFAIPGPGVHTIHVLTPLPVITDTVTIDGYTQTGATPNSLEDGDDAVIAIHLDGVGTPAGAAGLAVCGPSSIIKGLSISGFGSGVNLGMDSSGAACPGGFGAAANSAVEGSFVGILPDGLTVAPNVTGITLAGATKRVGGASSTQRNVISGNQFIGIEHLGGSPSIDGNYIGTDASGKIARGNIGPGIALFGSSALVGLQARNTVAHNFSGGILVASGGTGNNIASNNVYDNLGVGIDLSLTLASDGVTANDLNDVDAGPNNLQNFPEIGSVGRTTSGLSIQGTLDRPATAGSLTYSIGVYANSTCSESGFGEGERFLGAFNFVSANAGVESFANLTFPTKSPLPVGTQITLTATDPAGNTSEFSHCAALDASSQTFVVNSGLDTDDGNCTATVGGCTLREAINAANAHGGADIVAFNIPGVGVHVIAPTSALPTITDTVKIDGYTQPGAVPNTLADGDNAKIMIRVDGSSTSTGTFSFAVCSGNASSTELRGLSLTGFPESPIAVAFANTTESCAPANSVRIDGNFIGLAPDGSAAGNFGGIIANDSAVIIGGSMPSDRNLVSANANFGLVLFGDGTGSVILGNYIGTDATGTVDRGNGNNGVVLGGVGVELGGLVPNRIAFNGVGIFVPSSSANANVLFANDIFSNDLLAIDLAADSFADGPTINDADDNDAGGNGLQNFPVLTSAAQFGATMRLVGNLDVPAGSVGQPYALAFYASASCPASGRGEGQVYLGYVNVEMSGSQQEFAIDLPAIAPIGSTIAATATSTDGTSEFSTCVALIRGDLIFASGFD